MPNRTLIALHLARNALDAGLERKPFRFSEAERAVLWNYSQLCTNAPTKADFDAQLAQVEQDGDLHQRFVEHFDMVDTISGIAGDVEQEDEEGAAA